MRARIWLGGLLALSMALGCGKTEPTPAPAPQTPATASAPADQPAETAAASVEPAATSNEMPVLADIPTTESAKSGAQKPASAQPDAEDMAPPDEGLESEYSPKKEAELLSNLEKNPQDSELLLTAAKLMHTKAQMTESGDEDFGLYKKAAEYLRLAMAADPELAKAEDFPEVGATYFVDEARALSREKQTAAGLKSLTASIDAGLRDIRLLKTDADLEFLRQSPEFAPILEATVQKHKTEIGMLVDSLFSEKHDFAFEFDLKDTDGKPLVKKEFAGKVLMVNLWATWCSPCRHEIPDLIAAYDKYRERGFELVGLNDERETGEAANAVIKDTLQKLKINYRCAWAPEELFQQIPDFEGKYPTTLFFNRQGKVQVILSGMADEVVLEVIIERLLKESPPPANQVTETQK